MDRQNRDIQFTNTEDGVSIAFWVLGDGQPILVVNPQSLSHSELEWAVPSMSSLYEGLSARYQVVRYDPRGFGLSSDPPGGWGAVNETGVQAGVTTAEECFDLAAVVEACSLESMALLAIGSMGPVAIEFAAQNPDLVSDLILCDAMSDIASSHQAKLIQGQAAVLQLESDLGESVPYTAWEMEVTGDDLEPVARMATLNLRRTLSVLAHPMLEPGHPMLDWNADAFLPDLGMPTLILCSRNNRLNPAGILSDSQNLAARIHGAQLRMIDGISAPYFADQAQVLDAIDDRLKPERVSGATPSFRTVVFTDIIGSTKYVRQVGDEKGRTAIRELEQKAASLASTHSGQVVKNLGDGSLISFASNSSAISFALDLQDACGDGPLQLRVGMAAGEPIEEDGDIHGTVVAQASRIGDLGNAGEVIASDAVCQLAIGKRFAFELLGEASLKGFDQPQKVWRVTRP